MNRAQKIVVLDGHTSSPQEAAFATPEQWTSAGRKVVGPNDLNAYGTLFGGILIGMIKEGAEELTGMRLKEISNFVFTAPARAGDSIELLYQPVSARPDALRMRCKVVKGGSPAPEPRAVIASCDHLGLRDRVLGVVSSAGATWEMVLRRWIIADDVDIAGSCEQKLLELVDEAAVIYCRDQIKTRRVVTRRFDCAFHSGAELDDVVQIHCGVVAVGRTSLTIGYRSVARRWSGGEEKLVLLNEGRIVMIGTNEQGESIEHGL